MASSEPLDSQSLDKILWRHLSGLPYFRAFLRAVEDRFYQEVELPAPQLDLGSGDGHFASVAFARKPEFGLDPWVAPMLEAKTRDAYQMLVLGEGARDPGRGREFQLGHERFGTRTYPRHRPGDRGSCPGAQTGRKIRVLRPQSPLPRAAFHQAAARFPWIACIGSGLQPVLQPDRPSCTHRFTGCLARSIGECRNGNCRYLGLFPTQSAPNPRMGTCLRTTGMDFQKACLVSGFWCRNAGTW